MKRVGVFQNQGYLRRTIYNRLFILLFLLPLLFSVSPVSPVSAALRSCRGDPKFFLSNGEIVTSTAVISTDVASVTNVNYILHAPKGLSLLKIIYIAPSVGIPETASVVYDQLAGKYWLDIVVTAKVSGVSVIATAGLKSGKTITASGISGQHLIIKLS